MPQKEKLWYAKSLTKNWQIIQQLSFLVYTKGCYNIFFRIVTDVFKIICSCSNSVKCKKKKWRKELNGNLYEEDDDILFWKIDLILITG